MLLRAAAANMQADLIKYQDDLEELASGS
eukprot:SAG22_NODE_11595_length_478_cov_0.635884_1_plen_28_part_10